MRKQWIMLSEDHVATITTRAKAKSVVMISLEDYQAMEETFTRIEKFSECGSINSFY